MTDIELPTQEELNDCSGWLQAVGTVKSTRAKSTLVLSALYAKIGRSGVEALLKGGMVLVDLADLKTIMSSAEKNTLQVDITQFIGGYKK